jgi:hypothetical protein
MVVLALFQQKKPITFTSQFMVGGGGAFEETYFWFLIIYLVFRANVIAFGASCTTVFFSY